MNEYITYIIYIYNKCWTAMSACISIILIWCRCVHNIRFVLGWSSTRMKMEGKQQHYRTTVYYIIIYKYKYTYIHNIILYAYTCVCVCELAFRWSGVFLLCEKIITWSSPVVVYYTQSLAPRGEGARTRYYSNLLVNQYIPPSI